MLKNYYTIAKDGSFEIEIKKSRFICHLKRVATEAEAQDYIQSLKKEHWKANHNCVAYLIGDQNEIQRAYDDGEPSGTAGVPMLEVLKKQELKYVVAVVTRYFGGTKLGAGGLIRAYGKAVSTALKEIGVVERKLQTEISATVHYSASGKLENDLIESTYAIKEILYTDEVTFVCFVDEPDIAAFQAELTDWLNGQVAFKKGPQSYRELTFSGNH
ncbi:MULTISPECIES: YigZ family protein [Carnobacterium]|uniref:YigZ family protein n=3 Tax=Carnobacterium TaxID=2747 RepID=A0ABW4NN53_9LACT|nr:MULTISPECIES: YigZ family protein [unclassified Carnobacterium]ALV22706.1 protein co-occurring with transport systems [Carnobacterium sp. CP1]QQP70607.1 YigZ family protein [Carnobacterium sp. CS13]